MGQLMFCFQMKGTKLWLALLIMLPFVLIAVVTVMYFGFNNTYQGDDYHDVIRSRAKETSICTVGDIFQFQFEKAYIAKQRTETYGDGEYFSEKLDIEFDPDIQELGNEGQNRILFIENRHVILDFKYRRTELEFCCEGTWIYPHTCIRISTRFDATIGKDIVFVEVLEP